jgi:hypothetical protein
MRNTVAASELFCPYSQCDVSKKELSLNFSGLITEEAE